ncbi:MAG: flagellar basal body-associated FliL family protein [Methylococcales bacterium]|nr:flagellar basal body-associated FliL family protein [Methylococcales bacterium]
MRILILFLSFFLISNFVYAGDDEEVSTELVIEYLEMKPKFTVNLDKPKKYLMINVQLLVEGAESIEKIKKHLPALRHELIMIYSGRSAASLQTMEQREALRQESKEAITKALDKHSNSDGFRDVFFSEFLVQ